MAAAGAGSRLGWDKTGRVRSLRDVSGDNYRLWARLSHERRWDWGPITGSAAH